MSSPASTKGEEQGPLQNPSNPHSQGVGSGRQRQQHGSLSYAGAGRVYNGPETPEEKLMKNYFLSKLPKLHPPERYEFKNGRPIYDEEKGGYKVRTAESVATYKFECIHEPTEKELEDFRKSYDSKQQNNNHKSNNINNINNNNNNNGGSNVNNISQVYHGSQYISPKFGAKNKVSQEGGSITVQETQEEEHTHSEIQSQPHYNVREYNKNINNGNLTHSYNYYQNQRRFYNNNNNTNTTTSNNNNNNNNTNNPNSANNSNGNNTTIFKFNKPNANNGQKLVALSISTSTNNNSSASEQEGHIELKNSISGQKEEGATSDASNTDNNVSATEVVSDVNAENTEADVTKVHDTKDPANKEEVKPLAPSDSTEEKQVDAEKNNDTADNQIQNITTTTTTTTTTTNNNNNNHRRVRHNNSVIKEEIGASTNTNQKTNEKNNNQLGINTTSNEPINETPDKHSEKYIKLKKAYGTCDMRKVLHFQNEEIKSEKIKNALPKIEENQYDETNRFYSVKFLMDSMKTLNKDKMIEFDIYKPVAADKCDQFNTMIGIEAKKTYSDETISSEYTQTRVMKVAKDEFEQATRDVNLVLNKLSESNVGECAEDICKILHKLNEASKDDYYSLYKYQSTILEMIFEKACLEKKMAGIYSKLVGIFHGKKALINKYHPFNCLSEKTPEDIKKEIFASHSVASQWHNGDKKDEYTSSQLFVRRTYEEAIKTECFGTRKNKSLNINDDTTLSFEEKEYRKELRIQKMYGNVIFVTGLFSEDVIHSNFLLRATRSHLVLNIMNSILYLIRDNLSKLFLYTMTSDKVTYLSDVWRSNKKNFLDKSTEVCGENIVDSRLISLSMLKAGSHEYNKFVKEDKAEYKAWIKDFLDHITSVIACGDDINTKYIDDVIVERIKEKHSDITDNIKRNVLESEYNEYIKQITEKEAYVFADQDSKNEDGIGPYIWRTEHLTAVHNFIELLDKKLIIENNSIYDITEDILDHMKKILGYGGKYLPRRIRYFMEESEAILKRITTKWIETKDERERNEEIKRQKQIEQKKKQDELKSQSKTEQTSSQMNANSHISEQQQQQQQQQQQSEYSRRERGSSRQTYTRNFKDLRGAEHSDHNTLSPLTQREKDNSNTNNNINNSRRQSGVQSTNSTTNGSEKKAPFKFTDSSNQRPATEGNSRYNKTGKSEVLETAEHVENKKVDTEKLIHDSTANNKKTEMPPKSQRAARSGLSVSEVDSSKSKNATHDTKSDKEVEAESPIITSTNSSHTETPAAVADTATSETNNKFNQNNTEDVFKKQEHTEEAANNTENDIKHIPKKEKNFNEQVNSRDQIPTRQGGRRNDNQHQRDKKEGSEAKQSGHIYKNRENGTGSVQGRKNPQGKGKQTESKKESGPKDPILLEIKEIIKSNDDISTAINEKFKSEEDLKKAPIILEKVSEKYKEVFDIVKKELEQRHSSGEEEEDENPVSSIKKEDVNKTLILFIKSIIIKLWDSNQKQTTELLCKILSTCTGTNKDILYSFNNAILEGIKMDKRLPQNYGLHVLTEYLSKEKSRPTKFSFKDKNEPILRFFDFYMQNINTLNVFNSNNFRADVKNLLLSTHDDIWENLIDYITTEFKKNIKMNEKEFDLNFNFTIASIMIKLSIEDGKAIAYNKLRLFKNIDVLKMLVQEGVKLENTQMESVFSIIKEPIARYIQYMGAKMKKDDVFKLLTEGDGYKFKLPFKIDKKKKEEERTTILRKFANDCLIVSEKGPLDSKVMPQGSKRSGSDYSRNDRRGLQGQTQSSTFRQEQGKNSDRFPGSKQNSSNHSSNNNSNSNPGTSHNNNNNNKK